MSLRARTAPVVLVLVAACGELAPQPAPADPGDPLPGLTSEERARFDAGKALFARVFQEDAGLGPRFNESACNACHTDPADGGIGDQFLIRASRTLPDGACDLLASHGGLNVQRLVTRRFAAAGGARVGPPAEADQVSRFSVPPLFGLGLVEAIPLSTLQERADPDDVDGDGISGRIGRDAEGRPARFGRKADHASLRSFVAAAALQEMGLTSPDHPEEVQVSGAEHPAAADPAPDPEVDSGTVDLLTDFVRFLAPAPPRTPRDRELNAQVAEGGERFAALGCTRCHVPDLTTGSHASAALSARRVALYSDFLLHDMGEAFAGPCGPGASGTEYRTEPLAGLSTRLTYLHDGRAGGILDAILMHGGEAQGARDAFASLNRVQQEAVLRFLRTL